MISSAVLKTVGAQMLRSPRCYTTAAGAATRLTGSVTSECPETNFTSATKPRPFSEIPGPRALPIIGTQWLHYPGGPLHGMKFREKFARLHEMYGDIIKENIVPGLLTLVHVYNPDDIETIYRNEGKYPIRQAFLMMKRYNEKYNNNVSGIISSQGKEWHCMRSVVQKKLANLKCVRSYTEIQQTVADDFVDWIRKHRDKDDVIEDVLPHMYRFSTEAIGVVCFNKRIGALDENMALDSEAHQFITAVTDVMAATHKELDGWFLYLYFDTPLFRRFKKAQDIIRRISLKYTKEVLEQTSDMGGDDNSQQEKLLQYLSTETSLSQEEVITFISECFFAGVDTTSHFLGFALYNVCKHPEVMERLKSEILEFLPDHSPVTAEALNKMSYLRAVMKESLRWIPVTAGNGRTSSKELVLSGYTVPAGMFLGLHTDLLARLEEYVDDANSFRPERWMRDNVNLKLRPFTYLPFGFGTRTCLGKRLSEQEVSLALIKIFQNFDVEYRHNVELDYDVQLLNTPITPLKFSFSDI